MSQRLSKRAGISRFFTVSKSDDCGDHQKGQKPNPVGSTFGIEKGLCEHFSKLVEAGSHLVVIRLGLLWNREGKYCGHIPLDFSGQFAEGLK